jgi:hypothetical protein
MTFGAAIEAAKCGCKIARDGWNGKKMYVFYQHNTYLKEEDCNNAVLKKQAADLGEDLHMREHLNMFTAQGDVQVGWLASQSDMLSNDWRIIQ